jgi:anti-sigma factor RsiW
MTDRDLEAYLDESLPAADMARIEDELRRQPRLLARLSAINGRRDQGLHSLGEIWQRHRLTCPERETLGAYLLGTLPQDMAAYVEFHLETVGCRCCQANYADLLQQQTEAAPAKQTRRRRYFQSSAGYLPK